MFHLVDNLQDKSGNALAGYYVKLKVPGGAYATLYADTSRTPILSVSGVANTAVTDANGRYDLYVDDGTYDVEFFDKNDINQRILTVSSVPLLATTFLQSGTGAVARTLEAKARERLNVFDFIPVAEHAAIQAGTTTTDVTSFINAALTAAQTVSFGEKTLLFPAGTYRVSQINLRDCSYFNIHAEGTVNIVGSSGASVWIMGDDRLDDFGRVETFTRSLRMTGGPWLIGPLSGQTYATALKLQNFVDCIFENVFVSGTFTPTGGTGNRRPVEIDLSFNNAFYNCSFGYPGAPIGADKSYCVWIGGDNANNNRFYNCRGVGGGSGVANTFGVRVDSSGNAFYGIDISSIHTAFELNAAKGAMFINTYHEAVSRVCSVSFASYGCIFQPSYVDIAANGTAWDLSGAQTVGFQILGGNHRFNATGTTGLAKGANTFGLTYQPGISTNTPATGSSGTDNGSGGLTSLNDFQVAATKIAFPDTPVPSTNATTLDCYLEAAVTMGISVGATAQTTAGYTSASYTKIGRLVTVTGVVGMGAAVSGSGNVSLTGLPYACSKVAAVNLTAAGITYTGQLSGWADASQTKIELFQTTEAGARSAITGANLSASSEIEFSLTYQATS